MFGSVHVQVRFYGVGEMREEMGSRKFRKLTFRRLSQCVVQVFQKLKRVCFGFVLRANRRVGWSFAFGCGYCYFFTRSFHLLFIILCDPKYIQGSDWKVTESNFEASEKAIRAHVRCHCRCYCLKILQCQQRTKLVDCRASFPVRVPSELHRIDLWYLPLKWKTIVTGDVRKDESVPDFNTTQSNHFWPCFAWKANLSPSFRRIRFSGQTPWVSFDGNLTRQ